MFSSILLAETVTSFKLTLEAAFSAQAAATDSNTVNLGMLFIFVPICKKFILKSHFI